MALSDLFGTRRRAVTIGLLGLAVLVTGALAAALSSGGDQDTPDTPLAEVESMTSPLTGLPTRSPPRRAVVAKVDSHPSVTRFPGLADADLVYEVLVEGGITRYLAMFESQDADMVGPVRSLRSSDFDLVANLGEPVLVFSGANDPTLAAADSAPFTMFSPDSPGAESAFARDRELRAPHNLLASVPDVRSATGHGDIDEPFARQSGVRGEIAVAGLRIAFGRATDAVFEWDEARGEWLRWENGEQQTDETDRQLGTDTVLVLDSEYSHPPWDQSTPELVSVGGGEALVLSDGMMLEVRWSRPTPDAEFELTGSDGAVVAVPPGRTWVAFPQSDSVESLDQASLSPLIAT